MNNEVLDLFEALQTLFAEERAEITHRLWQSLTDIKEDLFTYYNEESYEEIVNRIDYMRNGRTICLTAEGVSLCEQVLRMPREDRLEITHILWQSLPSMYGLFEDPELIEELDRRLAEYESGEDKGIPN